MLAASCAPRLVSLPSDPGAPLPDFAETYRTVTAACAGVRTLTAELGLSGRAGGQGVRGRAIVGFERPQSMRLEGVAPFGPPAFIMVSRDMRGTLLLPRDNRVVRDEAPERILGALTGVALSPADLQAVLTGCVVPPGMPVAGRIHQNGWASIDVEGGASIYLEREGAQWRIRAGRRPGWQMEYPQWQGAFPADIRLRALDSGLDVNLSATVSQLETNVSLDQSAFAVNVPPAAIELTLAELRRAGPLTPQ